jgi:Putative MetA-pathway of phenol degradation
MRRTSFGLFIVFASLLLAARAQACSQCLCGSPTPPDYLLGDAMPGFDVGLEDRYLSKSNALGEAVGSESQYEHRLSALFSYRSASRVALLARLPYVFKRNVASPAGEAEEIARSQGLGDAELLGRYDALRFGDGLARNGALALIAAATVPTGSNDRKDGLGDRIEEHLQSGAGAWSGIGGLAFDTALPGVAFSASVLGRANSTNAHGYHYGDAVLFNAGVARSLSPDWQAALELNGRSAARDRVGEDAFDENTGGAIVYVAPGLRWSGLASLKLNLAVQIPLASDLNGDQTERTNLRFSIGHSIR